MNNENGDDADYGENDDHDALLSPVCPKVRDIREALQVLHDYMPFNLSCVDIRQKFNAISISISTVRLLPTTAKIVPKAVL